MNRRLAVKNLTLLVGGATLLPACLSQTKTDQATTLPPKKLVVSASQQQLLAEVCETLLPKTATPGANDLGLPRYVVKMLVDCMPPKEQQTFMAGLGQLDGAAQRQAGQSFGASTAGQRLALLERIDQQPQAYSPELVGFYRAARQLTIDGYTGSKFFMTQEVVYELVPSRYNGYFPVAKMNLAKARNGQS